MLNREQCQKIIVTLFTVISISLVFLMLNGCSVGRKTWGIAGSADAFKVSISDPESGNYVPEIIAGGGAHAMAFQATYDAGKVYPTAFAFSKRKSLWGLFSSDTSSGNVSVVYIAGSQESPENTVRILKILEKLCNPVRPVMIKPEKQEK